MENQPKHVIRSKTFWVNVMGLLAAVVGAFVPSVGAFIAEHFGAMGGAWALVNIALRLITKDKVYLA